MKANLPHKKHKPSGVEWLGEIPAHWEVKSACFDYEIQLGKMLQPEAAMSKDQEAQYFKAQHVQWESVRTDGLPTMWASKSDLAKYGVMKGDLLVCEGGEVGRAGIVHDLIDSVIIQNALHRVRSRKADLRFLMFTLEHAASRHWFEILCNRATIAHFTGEKFGSLKIPSPPLPEQRAISAFLDRETGRIDQLIEKKQRLAELLKEKRAALISHAVTKGLDPNAPMKDSGIEWLGEIPEHWEVLAIKRITTIPITDGPHETPELLDNGIPFISAEAIKNDKIDFDKMRGYISPEDHANFQGNISL